MSVTTKFASNRRQAPHGRPDDAEQTPESERVLPYVSIKYVLGFISFFVLLAVGRGPATTGAMIALCIWALFGPSQAIRALSLGITIKMLNVTVFTYTGLEGMLAWVLLFVAALRVLPYIAVRLSVVLPVLIFSILVGILSLATSEWAEISMMKLIAFTIGAVTALTAFGAVEERGLIGIRRWFFSLAVSIIMLSLPTFFFPAISRALSAEAGFQGILNQPQAFGIFIVPITAWLLSGVLFRPGKIRVISLTAVVGLFVLILLTKARTAMAAVLLSMVATFAVVIFVVNWKSTWAKPYRAVAVGLGLLVTTGLAALIFPTVVESLHGFVIKGDQKDRSLQDSFQASRGKGVALQWENFLSKPFTGYGFGIYPGGMMRENIVEFMGIPISAPVEKGFLPTAILEETGIIGTAAFLLLLLVLARRALNTSDMRWISLFFACIFINIGECVIFSVGGIGFFFWLLIGLATMGETSSSPETSNSPEIEQNTRTRQRVLYKRAGAETSK